MSRNAGNNGNSITVKEEFCLGFGAFTCATNTSSYGYLQTQYVYTDNSATHDHK